MQNINMNFPKSLFYNTSGSTGGFYQDSSPTEVYEATGFVQMPSVDRDKRLQESKLENKKISTNSHSEVNTNDIEELIKIFLDYPNQFFESVAKNLPRDEWNIIKEQIQNRCCDNCQNMSCNVEYAEKIGLDESGKAQGHSCLGWTNDEMIGQAIFVSQYSEFFNGEFVQSELNRSRKIEHLSKMIHRDFEEDE